MIIGAVGIAELKLRHYEIWILPLRYLTKRQDQHYRFTDYKLSKIYPEKKFYFLCIIFVFLSLNNYGITAI